MTYRLETDAERLEKLRAAADALAAVVKRWTGMTGGYLDLNEPWDDSEVDANEALRMYRIAVGKVDATPLGQIAREQAASERAYQENRASREQSVPMDWFYLSFASDEGFLGGCYVEANSEADAVGAAHAHGCNPGGEAMLIKLPREIFEEHVPPMDRYRLLTREELKDGLGE